MLCYCVLYMDIRMYVRPPTTKCHREQTAEPRSAKILNLCTLTKEVRLQIFIQIINFLDLLFQRQRFEPSTPGSSCVIILQTLIDRTNITIIKY